MLNNEKIEQLRPYWSQHKDNPQAVARFALTDLLDVLEIEQE